LRRIHISDSDDGITTEDNGGKIESCLGDELADLVVKQPAVPRIAVSDLLKILSLMPKDARMLLKTTSTSLQPVLSTKDVK